MTASVQEIRTAHREAFRTMFPVLRSLRKSQRITQRALAIWLDVPLTSVKDWEIGRGCPSPEVKKEWMRILGMFDQEFAHD